MPRTKTHHPFTIQAADSYEEDAALGKRKRLDGVSYNVFNVTLGNYDELRLRFRPTWNRTDATLMVYFRGCVWECVRYIETSVTKPLDAEQDVDGAVFGKFHMPPSEEDADSSFGPNSFWSNLTTGHIDTTIETLQRARFEHKEDEDRAVLDLFAIVHVQARPYVRRPELKQHVSMRLELILLGQFAA